MDYKKGIPRNNVFSKNNSDRTPSFLYAEDMAKADIGLMNVDQQGIVKVTNPLASGNALGDLSQALMSNKAQSFPVTVENMSHQEN